MILTTLEVSEGSQNGEKQEVGEEASFWDGGIHEFSFQVITPFPHNPQISVFKPRVLFSVTVEVPSGHKVDLH